MKNEGIPIVQEGFPFLLIFALAGLAFAVGGLWWASIPCFLLTLYTAFFFRNPERLAPVGANLVVSPADGRVIFVGAARESEFLNEDMQKISVFMSLFDVHVNRVPIDGTVRNMKYRKGRFMAAFEDRAAEENERNAMLIETGSGQKIVLVQIAGLVARRIVCYPAIGAFLMKGQRLGLIRFGSRCDIYFPKDAELDVKVGDRLLGGESVLGRLKESAKGPL